jgi:hypothetical protein
MHGICSIRVISSNTLNGMMNSLKIMSFEKFVLLDFTPLYATSVNNQIMFFFPFNHVLCIIGPQCSRYHKTCYGVAVQMTVYNNSRFKCILSHAMMFTEWEV